VARVQFTKHLIRFFPKLRDGEFAGGTVADLVRAIDDAHPGLGGYIVDDRGALRVHVNIFLDDELVKDRESLSDRVRRDTKVSIFQALSGG